MSDHPSRRSDDHTVGELKILLEGLRQQVTDGFAALRESNALEFRAAETDTLRVAEDVKELKDAVRRELDQFKAEVRPKLENLHERIDQVKEEAATRFRNLAIGVFLAFVAAGFSVLGYYLTQGAQ